MLTSTTIIVIISAIITSHHILHSGQYVAQGSSEDAVLLRLLRRNSEPHLMKILKNGVAYGIRWG